MADNKKKPKERMVVNRAGKLVPASQLNKPKPKKKKQGFRVDQIDAVLKEADPNYE